MQTQVLTLTRLLNRPDPGTLSGRCVICGLESRAGHPAKFGSNFTSHSYVKAGDVICEYCIVLFTDPTLRKNSWVVTQEGLRILDREAFLQVLLGPPEPPFYLYYTQARRKYGFLQSDVMKVSWSRERFWLATEMHDSAILVVRREAEEMAEVAQALREKGKMGRGDLAALNFSSRVLQRLMKADTMDLYRQALQYRGHPLWEVMVYVVP